MYKRHSVPSKNKCQQAEEYLDAVRGGEQFQSSAAIYRHDAVEEASVQPPAVEVVGQVEAVVDARDADHRADAPGGPCREAARQLRLLVLLLRLPPATHSSKYPNPKPSTRDPSRNWK